MAVNSAITRPSSSAGSLGAKLFSREYFSQLHKASTGLSTGANGGNRSRLSRSPKRASSARIGSAQPTAGGAAPGAVGPALFPRAAPPDHPEPARHVTQHRHQEGRHIPVVEV